MQSMFLAYISLILSIVNTVESLFALASRIKFYLFNRRGMAQVGASKIIMKSFNRRDVSLHLRDTHSLDGLDRLHVVKLLRLGKRAIKFRSRLQKSGKLSAISFQACCRYLPVGDIKRAKKGCRQKHLLQQVV